MKHTLPFALIFATIATLAHAEQKMLPSFTANAEAFNAKSVITATGKSPERVFTISSNEGTEGGELNERMVSESSSYPQLISGSEWFDGLYAMAVDDLKKNSVQSILNENYNNGQKIECECFETGQYWSYVWTRDVSYAGDLALAQFDPERLANSLTFKTSSFRPGYAPEDANLAIQIIQDTGSGGSWPVSTDRVTWAWAAKALVSRLPKDHAFNKTAYSALQGTIEADRQVVYNADLGLYGGEQSFLDWRTQTYPFWSTSNLSDMAAMPSLSTNVAHYQAITLTAELADQNNQPEKAAKYADWAAQLKTAINQHFWRDDIGQYASLMTSQAHALVADKFDMLGVAAAILSGVANKEQAERALSHYPHVPMGVPVYFPMQPTIRTYHNRGIWPFVSAYALKAATQNKHVPAANNAVQSLTRAAALHLSNMENMEWLTGKDYFDDGPAVNSPRQLWSVAGYLHLVMETTFGLRVHNQEQASVEPFLTNELAALLPEETATLSQIKLWGRTISIQLQLPKESSASRDVPGYFPVKSLIVNGETQSTFTIEKADLKANNAIVVVFDAFKPSEQTLNLVDTQTLDFESKLDAQVFSPVEPTITRFKQLEDGRVSIGLFDRLNKEVTYQVIHNGEIYAEGINEKQWTSTKAFDNNHRHCFAVYAIHNTSGWVSHPSETKCITEGSRITLTAEALQTDDQPAPFYDSAKTAYENWGAPTQTLTANFEIKQSGRYALQLLYSNNQHDIDSGVTAAVKIAKLKHNNTEQPGQFVMPNVARYSTPKLVPSTEWQVTLSAGEHQLVLQDFFNMSYLQANETYRHAGGVEGPSNRASIAEVWITRLPSVQ